MTKSNNDTHIDKFPKLFDLLKEWRARIEYKMADIRTKVEERGNINHIKSNYGQTSKSRCWLHKESSEHPIWLCREFQSKTSAERMELVKENDACYACLESGHMVKNCKRGFECREDGCQKRHHQLLHDAYVSGCLFHSKPSRGIVSSLLQLQVILCGKSGSKQRSLNVLWDSGM